MASGKSLTKEENARLKGVIQQLVREYGSQKALADAVPISQQMISYVMTGGSAGVHFATAIAKFCKFNTYAEMLGDDSVPKYGQNASWKANEPKAKAENPFPEAAYRLARETPAYIRREEYSAQAIAATVVWRWAMATEEEKTAAATQEALDALMKARAQRKLLSPPPPPPHDPEPKPLNARRAR